ncbi:MAG TPA: sigma factor, partial [Myxococcales bacterium]|nr:sigma factor [Myxococcales bacterium]
MIALQTERSAAAFEALVRRYQKSLYGFIARQLGDRARAEDVFQQAVFQIYSRISTCARPEAFKAWAFGVAANACRNAERSDRLRAVEPLTA